MSTITHPPIEGERIYERLTSARENAGLSKLALARLTGISVRAIHYYESSAYTAGRKKATVKAWAEACGYTLADVWTENEDDGVIDLRGKTFPCMTADLTEFRARRNKRPPRAA